MIHIFDIVGWLEEHNVPTDVAESAERMADLHGTVAVLQNGLITFEFAQTYNETVGSTGFDVRVQNALV
jgi:hypothetical protein